MKDLIKKHWVTGLCIAALTASIANPALAEHKNHHPEKHQNNRHTDFAKVTDVDPIYKTIKHQIPERSCWTETRYEPVNDYRSYTPTILGTLIGGAIGNEVGHSKTNKKVGTVVGGVLGATIARDWSHKSDSHSQRTRAVNEEVCETNYHTEYEEKIVGYNVRYRYQGQTYHTRMSHHPGKRLKVAVHVSPVD